MILKLKIEVQLIKKASLTSDLVQCNYGWFESLKYSQ